MRDASPARQMSESLESRRLFSVASAVADAPAADALTTPAECVSNEQVAADHAKVQQDTTKLQVDRAQAHKLLTADRAALKAATDAFNAKLAPLRQKLADDQAKCTAMLQADRRAIHDAYQAGQMKIQADLAAVHDAGSDPAKRHAALSRLAADREALHDALAPLMQRLRDDAAGCHSLLAADQQGISDVQHNDTTVQKAHDKLAADTRAVAEKLAADSHQLEADVQKLHEDLAHRCPDGDHHAEPPHA